MFSSVPGRFQPILQIGSILALLAGMVGVVVYLLAIKPVTTSSDVHFYVEASGGYAIITLDAGPTKITKSATVTTPWRQTVHVKSGTTVYLTASNPTQTGELICSITYGAIAGQQEHTDAPKDGVACAGIVP